jgi:NADPH:quinone reductase
MKAAQLSRFGGPDALDIVEIEKPSPGKGEVLIRVHAAGINYFEALMRQNRYAVTPDLPMIPGVEVAGVIEDVGEGVTAAVGDRVAVPLFAAGRAGGYAEHVAVDARYAIPLPDAVSFEVAVALMVQGLTALHAVRRSQPDGRAVLVTAAAGGVGLLLVQLLKRAGARLVIAAASSDAKLHLAQSLGADVLVNYMRTAWPAAVREATDGIGVDIAYDFVGGPSTKECLDALAPEGTLVFGALGRLEADRPLLDDMVNRNQSLQGLSLVPLLTLDNLKADLGELFTLASTGKLKTIIGGRFPLDRLREAHDQIDRRQAIGKLLLIA